MSTYQSYSKYIQSKLFWIDLIPEGWKVKKVTHSISFKVGFTPESGNSVYYGEGHPWVNISDLGDKVIYNPAKQITDDAIEKYKKSPAKKGSVLYSFKLSVGQVSFAGRDMYTNEAIAAFEESKDLLLPYFYYLAPIAIIQNASENIYGAKILNQEAIGNAKLIVPPKDEQQKIADFLDYKTNQIDALIEKKEALLLKLQEKRSALITQAVTKGINLNVPMKNTGLNWAKQIPQGWKVKKVTHSISYRVGFTPESGNAAYYGEGYPWVNISDLGDRVINYPAKQITDDAIEKYKKSPAKKGSVLYSFKLSVGQVSFAGRDMYTNEAIAAFEESKDLLLAYFYYLAPIAIIQNASENIYGAKILNQEAIGNAKLIVPPKDEQQKIADFLDKITHEIDLQTKKVIEAIGKLEEYRSALITNAVTGKIDVRDFDIPSEN